MQDPIIAEVGNEFNLTYKQAEELYKQYWMEYVAKNVGSFEYENIYVQGLGMFSAKRANFAALVRDKESGKYNVPEEIYLKAKKMLEYIDFSNSKRKNKKEYG